jgi:hypothetical protein
MEKTRQHECIFLFSFHFKKSIVLITNKQGVLVVPSLDPEPESNQTKDRGSEQLARARVTMPNADALIGPAETGQARGLASCHGQLRCFRL